MKKLLLLATGTFLLFTARAQWQVQDAGFTNDTLGFYEISIPDRNTAWAVCYDGKNGLFSGRPVLDFTRTTDGGNTWIPGKVGNDRTLRFSNISAIDGQEAWVAMHKIDFTTGGGVFHTTDGGITWEHTNPGVLFDNNSSPEFVYFKDKNHGIAVGDPKDGYFEVYLTNNKGKKWKRVPQADLPAPLANEVGWISGYAAIGNTIWFGTSAGRMYKSVDFGKTWAVHVVDPVPGTYVNEIAFLDDGLRGVAHLRGRGRTFVFSTSDGGITWTNFGQPANWKNSRMTAVPGTNAFISTAVHFNPIFQGSAISYDVGQTWTEIDNVADKAVCRFYDAHTGYAGGFFQTGPPFLGGIFKSEIVFQLPSVQKNQPAGQGVQQLNDLVKLYPVPARDVINLVLPEDFAKEGTLISLVSINGSVIQSTRYAGSRSIQMNVGNLPSGVYMLRISNSSQSLNKQISITR